MNKTQTVTIEFVGNITDVKTNVYPISHDFLVFDVLTLQIKPYKRFNLLEPLQRLVIKVNFQLKNVLMLKSHVEYLRLSKIVKTISFDIEKEFLKIKHDQNFEYSNNQNEKINTNQMKSNSIQLQNEEKFRTIETIKHQNKYVGSTVLKRNKNNISFEFFPKDQLTDEMKKLSYQTELRKESNQNFLLLKQFSFHSNKTIDEYFLKEIFNELKETSKCYVISEKDYDLDMFIRVYKYLRELKYQHSVGIICNSEKYQSYWKFLLKQNHISDMFISKEICSQLINPKCSENEQQEINWISKSIFNQSNIPYCDIVVFEYNSAFPFSWFSHFDFIICDSIVDIPIQPRSGTMYINCQRIYDIQMKSFQKSQYLYKSISIVIPLSTHQIYALSHILSLQKMIQPIRLINFYTLEIGNTILFPDKCPTSICVFIEMLKQLFQENKILFLTTGGFLSQINCENKIPQSLSHTHAMNIVNIFNSQRSGMICVDCSYQNQILLENIDIILHYDVKFDVVETFLTSKCNIRKQTILIGLIPDKSIISASFDNHFIKANNFLQEYDPKAPPSLKNKKYSSSLLANFFNRLHNEIVIQHSSFETRNLMQNLPQFVNNEIIILSDLKQRIDEKYRSNKNEIEQFIDFVYLQNYQPMKAIEKIKSQMLQNNNETNQLNNLNNNAINNTMNNPFNNNIQHQIDQQSRVLTKQINQNIHTHHPSENETNQGQFLSSKQSKTQKIRTESKPKKQLQSSSELKNSKKISKQSSNHHQTSQLEITLPSRLVKERVSLYQPNHVSTPATQPQIQNQQIQKSTNDNEGSNPFQSSSTTKSSPNNSTNGTTPFNNNNNLNINSNNTNTQLRNSKNNLNRSTQSLNNSYDNYTNSYNNSSSTEKTIHQQQINNQTYQQYSHRQSIPTNTVSPNNIQIVHLQTSSLINSNNQNQVQGNIQQSYYLNQYQHQSNQYQHYSNQMNKQRQSIPQQSNLGLNQQYQYYNNQMKITQPPLRNPDELIKEKMITFIDIEKQVHNANFNTDYFYRKFMTAVNLFGVNCSLMKQKRNVIELPLSSLKMLCENLIEFCKEHNPTLSKRIEFITHLQTYVSKSRSCQPYQFHYAIDRNWSNDLHNQFLCLLNDHGVDISTEIKRDKRFMENLKKMGLTNEKEIEKELRKKLDEYIQLNQR